jgi:hypothetical protein
VCLCAVNPVGRLAPSGQWQGEKAKLSPRGIEQGWASELDKTMAEQRVLVTVAKARALFQVRCPLCFPLRCTRMLVSSLPPPPPATPNALTPTRACVRPCVPSPHCPNRHAHPVTASCPSPSLPLLPPPHTHPLVA